LDVSIVVLARPYEATFTLECLGYHIIDEAMLIPDTLRLKLRLVLSTKIKRVFGKIEQDTLVFYDTRA
jgi:hypothetical protein